MANPFEMIDCDTTVQITLDGITYEVSQFNLKFKQATDYKGQPQNEVRGGLMTLTLSQTVPEDIYKWAMKTITKDGEVIFTSKMGSAPLRMIFKNAYCLDFHRQIKVGGGLTTALIISPEEININGIMFDNHWTRF